MSTASSGQYVGAVFNQKCSEILIIVHVLLYVRIADSHSAVRSPANAILIFRECARLVKLVFFDKIARLQQFWANKTYDIN